MLTRPLTESEVANILAKHSAEFSTRMPAHARPGVVFGYRQCLRCQDSNETSTCAECDGTGLVDAEALSTENQLQDWQTVAATLLMELAETRAKLTRIFKMKPTECLDCVKAKASLAVAIAAQHKAEFDATVARVELDEIKADAKEAIRG
jgi:methylphosphotriester-DNA--protein-cysteine methyltransferase